MAAYNWQVYSMEAEAGSYPVTPGQLLSYPLNVMPDGSIEYLPDISNFPDFPSSAKIMGKTSAMLPVKLTTWRKFYVLVAVMGNQNTEYFCYYNDHKLDF